MKRILFAAAMVAATALSAHAQLIAGDSYTIGSNLAAGQYPDNTSLFSTALNTLVSPGFATGRYGGGTGTLQFQTQSGGLSYAPLGINGADTGAGKVGFVAPAFDANTRNNARNLSPAAPASTTYWVSALVNRGAVPTPALGRDYIMSGFGGSPANLNLGTAGSTGLFFGWSGDTGALAIRYRSNTLTTTPTSGIAAFGETTLIPGSSALDNNTYALIFQINVNDGASGTGGGLADTVNYWVNPTNFSTTATMTATSITNGSVTTANVLSASTDLARLNYMARAWDSSAFFDEPRLGTTLASVTPGAGSVAVPEAGTVSLLALGFVTLGGMIIKRRKA